MRYCQYCGKQVPEDSVFCPACGKRLTMKPERPEYPERPETQEKPKRPETPEPPEKPERKQSSLWGCTLVVLCISLLAAGIVYLYNMFAGQTNALAPRDEIVAADTIYADEDTDEDEDIFSESDVETIRKSDMKTINGYDVDTISELDVDTVAY